MLPVTMDYSVSSFSWSARHAVHAGRRKETIQLFVGYKGLTDNARTPPFWGRYYVPDTLPERTGLYEDWGTAKWRTQQAATK